ncbi:hypothetical protein ACFV4X_12450 [Streptomyces ardesiacus]|uniref:hypothetical protein n=1 Tax=Streptomyces ardesiacus TaxID=285564 RepID=UPI003665A429
MMSNLPAQAEHPRATATAQGTECNQLAAPVLPPYEMRLLRSYEDLDAVAELVTRRTAWLAARQLPRPYTGDVVTLYREQWVEAVALFEDGHPVGCLRLHRDPPLSHWDVEETESSLQLSLAYSAPGAAPDKIGRLMTLWAQDFAARLGMTWVRCEVSTDNLSSEEALRLLTHAKGCGWQFVRFSRDQGGRPLVLLQLPARAQLGLHALIRCTVSIHPGMPSTPAPGPHR